MPQVMDAIEVTTCCWLSALARAARQEWSCDYWFTRAVESLRWGRGLPN